MTTLLMLRIGKILYAVFLQQKSYRFMERLEEDGTWTVMTSTLPSWKQQRTVAAATVPAYWCD